MDCTVCNSARGKRTRVEFPDVGKAVSLAMCVLCHEDFSTDETIVVTRTDE